MARQFALATMVIVLIATATPESTSTAPPPRESDEAIELVREAFDLVEKYHHGEPFTRKQLAEAAIEGMLLRVDPGGGYLDEHLLASFRQTVTFKRGYTGLKIGFQRHLIVLAEWQHSGDLKGEVFPGDRIVEISGRPVSAMSESEALLALYGGPFDGGPNTRVNVTVIPLQADDPRNVTLIRLEQ